jgi:hypothetical protein
MKNRSNQVYVLEHFDRDKWRPLVSGVKKKRVEEHLEDLVHASDIDASDLRVTVYVPKEGGEK